MDLNEEIKRDSTETTSPWPAVVAILIICLTIIAVVWMLTA